MTTFSQLVDDLVVELVRPDLRITMATYANQTIREIHSRPQTRSQTFFDANRMEYEETIAADGPWLWTIPSVTSFQKLEAVYLPEMDLYIRERTPSVAHRESAEPFREFYWYRSGDKIAVAGPLVGLKLQLSYFQYPRTLSYKAAEIRVVRFDVDTDAYVLVAGGGTPTEDQLLLETSWPLQRWPDSIKEGVRAKTYKRIGDNDRTRMSFSAFEAMKEVIWNSESSS